MRHARHLDNGKQTARRRRRRRRQPEIPEPQGSGRPVVLQVLPSLISGGVERGTIEVARALRAAGGTAIVASSGGPMVKQLRRAGIKHVTLPLKSKNPFTIWRNIKRLEEIIEAHHVDIVHARSRAPAWSAMRAARNAGAHFITTFHAAYGHSSGLKRSYNSVMAMGDVVIAVSDFIARHVADTYEINPHRLRTIPRGVDVATFHPDRVGAKRIKSIVQDWAIATDMPVIVLPGRVSRIKGHRVLVDALSQLGREDLTVLMVGPTEDKPAFAKELHKQIEQAGLGLTIRLVGPTDDMAAIYAIADLVVCPSLVPEGFGRTVAEAMAMGKPVIVSDQGAPPELVAHGETGWVVPAGDADALADAISRTLSLPEHLLEEMGRRGMQTVQSRFTKDHMCNATLALYDELLVASLYDADILIGDTAPALSNQSPEHSVGSTIPIPPTDPND
ncbi:MAG: glycosyltransferase family 4 protein [Pseudomonadota bacterium]